MNIKRETFAERVKKDWKRNRSLYILVIHVLIFYPCFSMNMFWAGHGGLFTARVMQKLRYILCWGKQR